MTINKATIIDQLLLRRREELASNFKHQRRSTEPLVKAARSATGRMYADITADVTSLEVIWGNGGQQTRRIKECIANNVDYIHIPPQRYDIALDTAFLKTQKLL